MTSFFENQLSEKNKIEEKIEVKINEAKICLRRKVDSCLNSAIKKEEENKEQRLNCKFISFDQNK